MDTGYQTEPNNSRGDSLTLSEHDLEYLAARAVNPEVARAAGCFTARRRAEIPEAFSERQRRRTPSLIAPHLSPDGETVGYQKRDKRPGKDKQGKPVKWASPKGARLKLASHPWTRQDARTGTDRLWLTEGYTRMLALTGLGETALSYQGCECWQQDGEPLACFDHLNLEGRIVYDVPDADYRTNANVQRALGKRVAFLKSRGATVLVVSVPEISDDLGTGLDDYLASEAGGDLEALVMDARPFEPVDTGKVRLSKDERLRAGIESLGRAVDDLEARKISECSALSVARYMVEVAAPAHGRLVADGIQVRPSIRQVAAGVRVSVRTVSKALDRLENDLGFLKTVEKASGKKATSYLITYPSPPGSALGKHKRGERTEGKETQEGEGEKWLSNRELYPSVYQTRALYHLPPLRNSKVVHDWARKDGRRVVVHSDYVARYGKKREAIIRYVLEQDGATEAELHEKFASKTQRMRTFRQRWLGPMLDDGVFLLDGSDVVPAPDWLVAIKGVRERTDEDLDNRLQDEKIARQREAYREVKDRPIDPTPDLAGPEKAAEIFAEAQKRDEAARIEEQRSKVGMTAEVFLADTLRDVSGFGWRELRALWVAKGGKPEHLRRAVKGRYRFRREYDRGPLYVETTNRPEPEREPAPVAILRDDMRLHVSVRHVPKEVDGVDEHGPFCECEWCDAPASLQPKYVSTGR